MTSRSGVTCSVSVTARLKACSNDFRTTSHLHSCRFKDIRSTVHLWSALPPFLPRKNAFFSPPKPLLPYMVKDIRSIYIYDRHFPRSCREKTPSFHHQTIATVHGTVRTRTHLCIHPSNGRYVITTVDEFYSFGNLLVDQLSLCTTQPLVAFRIKTIKQNDSSKSIMVLFLNATKGKSTHVRLPAITQSTPSLNEVYHIFHQGPATFIPPFLFTH